MRLVSPTLLPSRRRCGGPLHSRFKSCPLSLMSEARVRLAAWHLKDLLDGARSYWILCEQELSVEEQAMLWDYFDSKERTFLKNRVTEATRPARKT